MFGTRFDLLFILVLSITNSLFAQDDSTAIGKDGEEIIDQAQYDIAKKFTEYVLEKDLYDGLNLPDKSKIWILIHKDTGKLAGNVAPSLFRHLKKAKNNVAIGPKNSITQANEKLKSFISNIFADTKFESLKDKNIEQIKKDLEDIRNEAIKEVKRLKSTEERPNKESLIREIETLRKDSITNQEKIKSLQDDNQKLKESIEQLEEKGSTDSPIRPIDWVILFLIFILTSLIGIRLFLEWKRQKNRPANNNHLEPPIEKLINESNGEILNKLNNLNKLNSIEQKVENVLSTIKAINKPFSQNNQASTRSQHNPSPVSASKFYARYPTSEGVFTQTTKTQESASMYEVRLNNNTATFKFINQRNLVKQAVGMSHIYLTPACQENNNWNENATQIITLKPGQVQKTNGKWKVIRKALIQYKY